MSTIQWYPGHMAKARRMMEENIKLVDLVMEITDARAPLSTRNPDIDVLGKNKSRLIILNCLMERRYFGHRIVYKEHMMPNCTLIWIFRRHS